MALIQRLLFILVPLAGQAKNRAVPRAGPWAKCQAQARARRRAVPGTGTGCACQCRAWAGPACSAQLENYRYGVSSFAMLRPGLLVLPLANSLVVGASSLGVADVGEAKLKHHFPLLL